jgi:hypothetical protein
MLTLDVVPNLQGNLGHSSLVLRTLWITLLFRNRSLKNPPDEDERKIFNFPNEPKAYGINKGNQTNERP